MAYYLNRMKKTDRTAYEAALHLLKYRGQSEKELRRKLKDRGYEESEIEKSIEKLKHYGYVDDESLAEDVFRALRNRKCYGDSYIQRKMKDQGLNAPSHVPEEEERKNAVNLLLGRIKIYPGLRDDYRKAASFLLRRGFSSSAIHEALSILYTDIPEDD
ncbi:MAG: RecX family transcriptional regulator [Dialister sp.]|nr:RecX family transcriptional regulator [Dialister sp.]